MTAIADARPSVIHSHIRPFDVRQDLGAVADLVEICFSDTLDPDGRDYLSRMRTAANNSAWTSWINTAEWASPAMSGFVWIEDGRLVGNVSLIPYFVKGRRNFLIANVAVHPDYRQRGIGRELTHQAAEFTRLRGCPSVWLHVREDNHPAVMLYHSLGFLERARRTTWFSLPEFSSHINLPPGYRIASPTVDTWIQQRTWLERSYPARLSWHMPIRISSLHPGWAGILKRFLEGISTRQWALLYGDKLQAAVSWQTTPGHANALWIAAPLTANETLLQALLVYARQKLPSPRTLMIDYPARQLETAIYYAGFRQHQTLVWMELPFNK